MNYQHEFIAELAEILRDRPDDAGERLNDLTNINDSWMQNAAERQSNTAMIEAVYEAIEELA